MGDQGKDASLKNKSSSLKMPVSILKNSVDVCLIPLTDQLRDGPLFFYRGGSHFGKPAHKFF